ncbi:MAG TPA: hypothetical protein VGN48_16730 [Pedococcus sp.]|jgi:hypothetical protein|nr:hypothetical protein [Pedococcus sp.]
MSVEPPQHGLVPGDLVGAVHARAAASRRTHVSRSALVLVARAVRLAVPTDRMKELSQSEGIKLPEIATVRATSRSPSSPSSPDSFVDTWDKSGSGRRG